MCILQPQVLPNKVVLFYFYKVVLNTVGHGQLVVLKICLMGRNWHKII